MVWSPALSGPPGSPGWSLLPAPRLCHLGSPRLFGRSVPHGSGWESVPGPAGPQPRAPFTVPGPLRPPLPPRPNSRIRALQPTSLGAPAPGEPTPLAGTPPACLCRVRTRQTCLPPAGRRAPCSTARSLAFLIGTRLIPAGGRVDPRTVLVPGPSGSIGSVRARLAPTGSLLRGGTRNRPRSPARAPPHTWDNPEGSARLPTPTLTALRGPPPGRPRSHTCGPGSTCARPAASGRRRDPGTPAAPPRPAPARPGAPSSRGGALYSHPGLGLP